MGVDPTDLVSVVNKTELGLRFAVSAQDLFAEHADHKAEDGADGGFPVVAQGHLGGYVLENKI